MKKTTVLNLYKDHSEGLNYVAFPDFNGNRKTNSLDVFTLDKYYFGLSTWEDRPTLYAMDKETQTKSIAVDFFKRVNNQFFGICYYSGKCVYGLYSHPWHKKVTQTEFMLFESDVNFNDLIQVNSKHIKSVPEFSNQHNWLEAYQTHFRENISCAFDYADSRPLSDDQQRYLEIGKPF